MDIFDTLANPNCPDCLTHCCFSRGPFDCDYCGVQVVGLSGGLVHNLPSVSVEAKRCRIKYAKHVVDKDGHLV